MPSVQLRTLRGKVDYEVEQQVRELVMAYNALDQQVQAQAQRVAASPSSAQVQQALTDLAARLDALTQRVQALETP